MVGGVVEGFWVVMEGVDRLQAWLNRGSVCQFVSEKH